MLTLFSGDEFESELNKLGQEIENLGESIRQASPLDVGVETEAWPALFSTEVDRIWADSSQFQPIERQNESLKRILREQKALDEKYQSKPKKSEKP